MGGFVTGIVQIVDENDVRIDQPRDDGSFQPLILKLSSDFVGVSSFNGALTEVEVSISDTGGAVLSVFGRTGNVVAADGDIPADFVTFVPDGDLTSTRVQDVIVELRDDTDAKIAAVAPPFADTTPLVSSAGDGSKRARFNLNNLSPAVTRVITIPDSNIEIDDVSDTRLPREFNTGKRITSLGTTGGPVEYFTFNTPALAGGQYMVKWSVEGRNSATNGSWGVRVQINNLIDITNPGGGGFTEEIGTSTAVSQRLPRSGHNVVDLDPGVQQIDMDLQNVGVGTATLDYGIISLWRVG